MMFQFDESLIPLLEYKEAGKLPDLFTMEDGTPVTRREQWDRRRKELYKSAVELQYGTMPPEPEFLEVEMLDDEWNIRNYRIITGTRACPVQFTMRVVRPSEQKKYPAIVDGDLCWRYWFDKDFIRAATDRGIMLVLFNRTELVPDVKEAGRNGPLYRTYPDRTFGAIGAWAWGYSRCVDALEKLGIAQMDQIAFSGHSRGGKTALLAGVLDERAAIVNANCSGAGGAGCYRVDMKAVKENGEAYRSEDLRDLMMKFHFWFGPELEKYQGREAELPFDEHFLKALVAPRVLLLTEAASDIWANSLGTWQTSLAAREAYKLLGCEENDLLYFRRGYHEHHIEDLKRLVRIMEQHREGRPFEEGSFKLPIAHQEPIFSWRCPG